MELQDIIAIAGATLAAGYAGRRMWRTVTAGGGCGCGSRGCGQAGSCDPTTGVKVELGKMPSRVGAGCSQNKHEGFVTVADLERKEETWE